MTAAASTTTAPTAQSTGTDRRTPIKGVRKHTAAAMVSSAFTAPHVTVFLTVDVTRDHRTGDAPQGGWRVRIHARGDREGACASRCGATLRSTRAGTSANQEIVEYGGVQLGIAVASDRGLIVPVIPDAHLLAVGALTDAIAEAAAATRDGSIAQERLAGGTITISNIGVFGVDAGTPILVPGQAAILATGAVRRMPWEFEDAIALRSVMSLSLSFDHRLVDGEQGAKFLADIGRILQRPGHRPRHVALTVVQDDAPLTSAVMRQIGAHRALRPAQPITRRGGRRGPSARGCGGSRRRCRGGRCAGSSS